VAFAEFKVAVIGPDGRPGKATRLRADTDDPARGDVILLAGRWHEVVDVAHVPDEHKRPRTVGTVVFVRPLTDPPAWLRAIGPDGGQSLAGTTTSKVIHLTALEAGSEHDAPDDLFAAATVRQEASFSQMATLARAPAAVTIEHRPPSSRPSPAAPMHAPDVLRSRGGRSVRFDGRILSLLPILIVAALAAVFAASYFLS
jgi:hypothetical protein